MHRGTDLEGAPLDPHEVEEEEDTDDKPCDLNLYVAGAARFCAIVLLILFVPALLLGPSLKEAFQGSRSFGTPDLESSVTSGWTVATFPHPIDDASRCRNPNSPVATGSTQGFSSDTYICDPDSVMTSLELQELAAALLKLQSTVRVPCGVGSTNTSLQRPFFVGVAIMKHAGMHSGQLEGGDLDTEIKWFGDGLLNKWSLSFERNGAYCPNGAVIVVTTGQRYTEVRLQSEYFMDFDDAHSVYETMKPSLRDGLWKNALVDGVRAFQEYFEAKYEGGTPYSAWYWLFLVSIAVALVIGAACAIVGFMRPSADPSGGALACCCIILAGVLSYIALTGHGFLAPGSPKSKLLPFTWAILYSCVLLICLGTVCDRTKRGSNGSSSNGWYSSDGGGFSGGGGGCGGGGGGGGCGGGGGF